MGHGRREHPSAPRRALHLSRAVRGRGSIHVSGPATNNILAARRHHNTMARAAYAAAQKRI